MTGTISIKPPTGVVVGKSFAVSGSLSGYSKPPILVYADAPRLSLPAPTGLVATGTSNQVHLTYSDVTPVVTAVAWHPLPAGATVSTTAFSFTCPAFSRAGEFALAVADHANLTVLGYVVFAVTATPLPVTPSKTGTTVMRPNVITSADGTHWSIGPGGHVTVNGIADQSTSNAEELFYVAASNHVYQRNKAGNWFFKSKPSDVWTATKAPTGG